MSVNCPECDTAVPLPDELVAAGVEKIRCRNCGTRFCVLPGGHTLALQAGTTGGTLQPGSSSQPPSSGVACGSDNDTPVSPTPGGAGSDLPHLTGAVGHDQQAAILAAAHGDRLVDYPKLPVGTVFRQKYRIETEIGHGASAVVYRARDVDADIDVALKVVGVVGGQADGIRRAWAEEYKARRQVPDGSHLLILESPQVQEIDGTTYVALPQELGQSTLRDWLKDKKHHIAEHREEALSLFGQICRGVEALHKRNLAHLDLKPENIILVEQGKDRFVAKVGDFGLARAAGSLTRREGAGTPAYMAPEQVRSAREKEIGPWSDIYALGCILFELLDGYVPFSGRTEELKDKHLNIPPPELEGVPSHLDELVMACLAKKRRARPTSVAIVTEKLNSRNLGRDDSASIPASVLLDVRVSELPKLDPDAKVLSWCKRIGEPVALGDPILEIVTNKAVKLVKATSAGTLRKIFVQKDDPLFAGQLLGQLECGISNEQPYQAGDIARGVVDKIMNWGAFVDIGPMGFALVHISEVSSQPLAELTDLLTEGLRVHVRICEIDGEGRMLATMIGVSQPSRFIEEQPSEIEGIKPGMICEGVVDKVFGFGIMVNLGPGKSGLVYKPGASAKEFDGVKGLFYEGQRVHVKVMEIDRKGRIRLTMEGVDQSS